VNGPLARVGRRYLGHHRWQAALMILGIALGVAVMVAIDLANSAASRAFDLSTDAVAGRATHQIVSGPDGLPEEVYTRLRVEAGIREAAPIITYYVTSPQLGSQPLQLLGVDPFAEAPFRSYLVSGQNSQVDASGLAPFLTQPGMVIVSEGLAAGHALHAGDAITLNVGGREERATIAGLLRPRDRLSQRALDSLILTDISTAQELAGLQGRLDHVDLILPEGSTALVGRIAALLPAGARLVPAGTRAGTVAQMTAAFRLNLTALSLLALVVGMFLIYNSMTFSVIQRRALFGTLRCLGVTRGEIARMVLGEALIVGAVGSVLGLALGVLLGQGAVRLVTQTINDLYYVVTVRDTALSGASLARGALLGMLATLASAAVPAREAASVPPQLALSRSNIEDRARRMVPWTAAAGGLGLLLGAGLLAISARSVPISFAGLFLVVIGFALLAPLVTLVLLGAATPLTGRLFGVLGRMAPRSVTGALSRTAVAIAALMVAVSVTIGVGLMVGSFRATVETWLGQTLYDDIYISAPGLGGTRPTQPLDPRIVPIAGSWPGVQQTEVLRATVADSPAGEIAVSAVRSPDFVTRRWFASTDGGVSAAAEAVKNGAVLASEPLANRLGLAAHGASLTLYTDRGPHTFPVAGIYRDYASSEGTVIMSLDIYQEYWTDTRLTAMSLVLAPGSDADQVARDLGTRLNAVQALSVRPNRALRDEVLRVFDQAFAITGALQLLAAVVAFIGVLSALLSLQLERAHELGMLRAIGLTSRQLRGTVFLETGLIGAVAGLLSMPTGLVLALILTFVINRRSFGWTLQFQVRPELFAQALALAVTAALLAGVYPAWRLGRLLAAEVLRGE
jgi:putative ABC transport system permease protein